MEWNPWRATALPQLLVARTIRQNIGGAALFVQECLRKPGQMGAIVPSSPGLAKAMSRWLPEDPRELVVELGPGSGPVTEALLARGLAHDRLVAIEKSEKMAEVLRQRFPTIHVLDGDAGELDKLLHKNFGAREVGAVISSLPLRSFPPALVDLITRKIHEVLKPGGHWVQFTYAISNKRVRGSEPFQLHNSRVVWLNLPPARVNVYRKLG